VPFNNWLKNLGVNSKDLYKESLDPLTQTTANTAGESVTFKLPLDQLLYGISIATTKDTDGSLGDFIKEIEFKLDGARVVRNLSGGMIKAINYLDHRKTSTGYYFLKIADDVLGTDPIPLNQFTSASLKVTVTAAGSGVKAVVTPTLQLGKRSSYPRLSNIGQGRVLVETFLPMEQYGTATGDLKYDHMRGQGIVGYVLETGDNGTLSDTTFSTYTLQLIGKDERLTPQNKVALKVIKEENTQDANGNALPTGYFYIDFPDSLRTSEFTTVRSLFTATVAGTQKQVRVLERYILGGQ
jgi:hypothetical protein